MPLALMMMFNQKVTTRGIIEFILHTFSYKPAKKAKQKSINDNKNQMTNYNKAEPK
jgi:hypothetical protein